VLVEGEAQVVPMLLVPLPLEALPQSDKGLLP